MKLNLVEEYNTAWPSWFEQIRDRIKDQLQGLPHTIEHVGSTAVPGMTAKPVIDIDIVIDPGTFPEVRDCLRKLGYRHQGDLGIIGREAFNLIEDGETPWLPPHHLYVCERGNHELQKHLAFRDFMRQHPKWCQKLSKLKRLLCEEYDNDRQAYIDGKATLVADITELALMNTDLG